MSAHEIRLSVCYFWVFTVIGVYGTHLFPYLSEIGLDGGALGAIGAVAPLAMVVMPTVWGLVADRLGEATGVLRWTLLGAALPVLLLPWLDAAAAIGAVLLVSSLFRVAVVPLLDSATFTVLAEAEGLGRAGASDFGRVRLWGSVGFIATALGVGLIADWSAPIAVPIALAASGGLAFGSSLWVPRAPRERTVRILADMRTLLQSRPLRALLTAGAVNRLGASAPLLFYPIHLKATGWDNFDIGWFWTVGVAAEVVFFRLAPRLVAWASPRWLLVAAYAAVPVRWSLLAVVDAPALVIAIQVLHALTFATYYYTMVSYLARTVPLRLRASGQALFAALSFGLAGGLSSFVGGWLYDAHGIDAVLWVAVGLGCAALAMLWPIAVQVDPLPAPTT
jgi:PPP family 3-phenylpropionic acid transporter